MANEGVKTSEYKVTQIAQIIGGLIAVIGTIYPHAAPFIKLGSIIAGSLLSGLTGAGYAISRGLAKQNKE